MKNLLKKLAISASVLSMLVAPTSVFAGENVSNISVNENNIAPLYFDNINITIGNGETVYFDNVQTGLPFYIKEGTSVNLAFHLLEPHRYFECGIVDENNQVVMSFDWSDFYGMAVNPQIAFGQRIPKTGRYRIFFMNYNLDSVTLTGIKLNDY